MLLPQLKSYCSAAMLCCCLIIFVFTINLPVSYRPSYSVNDHSDRFNAPPVDHYEEIRDKLFAQISPERIKSDLHLLTRRVHVAGTVENRRLMDRIEKRYRALGLRVRTTDYQVLLTYPDYARPNTVQVQLANGGWRQLSGGRARKLGPSEARRQQSDRRARHLWNMFSANGTVSGPIIFAGIGDEFSYSRLRQSGLQLRGAIALIAYDTTFRGNQVRRAEKEGIVGVIFFTDEQHFGPTKNASSTKNYFPSSGYMPPMGSQLGTVRAAGAGDLATPGLPAKSYTQRRWSEKTLRKQGKLPTIPVTPVGYGVAEKIRNELARSNGSSTRKLFKLTVHSRTVPRAPIRNVVGSLRGRDAPDEWVLVGSHVDAWTFGAQDPNSATAIQLELARAFSDVSKATGWRPRRSILFCSWDAEEAGSVGSIEWMEEYRSLLPGRVVALVNINAVKGNQTLRVKGVPLLAHAVASAAKEVPYPNAEERGDGFGTIFDAWFEHLGEDKYSAALPHISNVRGGGDSKSFLQILGLPVVDLSFIDLRDGYPYPLYHSAYEIPWAFERFVDAGYLRSVAVARVAAAVVLRLADSPVVPLNASHYASAVDQLLAQLQRRVERDKVFARSRRLPRALDHLLRASARFQAIAARIQRFVDSVNDFTLSPAAEVLRMLNGRLISLESCFVDSKRVSRKKHVLFSSSGHSSTTLPLVRKRFDAFVKVSALNGDTKKPRRHLVHAMTLLQYSIESAILMLDDILD